MSYLARLYWVIHIFKIGFIAFAIIIRAGCKSILAQLATKQAGQDYHAMLGRMGQCVQYFDYCLHETRRKITYPAPVHVSNAFMNKRIMHK